MQCHFTYSSTKYSMYGAVPLRTIKQALLNLKVDGRLHRAKMVELTNCTFDGHIEMTAPSASPSAVL